MVSCSFWLLLSLFGCNNLASTLLYTHVVIFSFRIRCLNFPTQLLQLANNFFNRLDKVTNELALPCHCRVNGFKDVHLNGIFQHLSPAEADKFVRVISGKLMHWAAKCTTDGTSTSSVVRATCSGKGQLSIGAILMGPFQDWLCELFLFIVTTSLIFVFSLGQVNALNPFSSSSVVYRLGYYNFTCNYVHMQCMLTPLVL